MEEEEQQVMEEEEAHELTKTLKTLYFILFIIKINSSSSKDPCFKFCIISMDTIMLKNLGVHPIQNFKPSQPSSSKCPDLQYTLHLIIVQEKKHLFLPFHLTPTKGKTLKKMSCFINHLQRRIS